MFRLIKLAMYAFIGYALYELYQGMVAQRQGGGGRRERGMFPASRTQEYNAGLSSTAGQNLTGGGSGRTEETQDSDGGSIRYNVGRGVTA